MSLSIYWKKNYPEENRMGNENIIKLDSKIVRDTHIVFNEMDGETIMMSIENGEYYGMNSMGSRIWNLLETPKAVSEICDALLIDFDVTMEQCVKDLLPFLNRMAVKGVVKISAD
jgi:hypothetical protein